MTQAPSERSIGPFRVSETLGRGGMGIVYRAVHEETGAEVALKTVRVPNQRMLAGIRREIYTLARIRHPGIVRIVAQGMDKGVPWYAMDLLEGATLRQHLLQRARGCDETPLLPESGVNSWWTRSRDVASPWPLSPSTAAPTAPTERPPSNALALLAPFGRLCSALAFLHGEGIVHRDLKPDNIVLQPDGSPVIVDFGLMTQFGGEVSREALDVLSEAMGSLPYMSPEQARGDLCDARADLYALGCILYEILAGRPPFLGGSPFELMALHAASDPLPPSLLAPGIPQELDRLVLQLLAKKPRDRVGHADVVIEALARMGLSERGRGDPPPRAYLYRPSLSGRTDLLYEMKTRLLRAAKGEGGLVLLGGESGSGKTRLAMALGSEARHKSIPVLAGESQPLHRGDPEALPLQALRGPLLAIADRCREKGISETERLLGSRGKILARYEPSLATLPGMARFDEPEDLPPSAARDRLFNTLRDTLMALTGKGSLLLILEDLHGADDLTLAFLEMLLRSGSLDHTGLLILGTLRTEEAPPALLSLAERASFVRLAPLDEAACSHIVSEMLALSQPPEPFVRTLGERSRGNPFFVAEYLRAAVAEGLLARDVAGRWTISELAADGQYPSLPMPASLRDLVSRRLVGLPEEARRMVEVAAVAAALEREVQTSLLGTMAGATEAELVASTAPLLARQILEEAEGTRMRFVHDQIREVAYEIIGAARRKELHHAAATALEGLPEAARETRLAQIGRHWEEAGEVKRACACYAPAARSSAARYAYRDAERLDRAYIALSTFSEERVEVRIHLGNVVLSEQGRYAEAREQNVLALEESRTLGSKKLEAHSLMALGNIVWFQGRTEEAKSVFDQVLALVRELGDRRREGITLNVLGTIAQKHGDKEEARSLFEAAIALVRVENDQKSEGMIANNLAAVIRETGRAHEAEIIYRRALEVFKAADDRRGAAIVLGNLALLVMELGRLAEARPLFEEALAVHRHVGNRRSESMVQGNLASLLAELGERDEARRLLTVAVATLREIGDRASEAFWLTDLAVMEADDGRHSAAAAMADQALEILEAIGDRRGQGLALRAKANIERRVGSLDQARRLLGRAEELLTPEDAIELARCLIDIGFVELAIGGDAVPLFERAGAIARAMGVSDKSALGKALAELSLALGRTPEGRDAPP